MSDDSLIQALPDLVAFVGRDGTLLKVLGGRCLGLAAGELAGKTLADLWSDDAAKLLLMMIRRTLRERGSEAMHFSSHGREYAARIAAHGRDRALCIIREAPAEALSAQPDELREAHRGNVEPRELFARLAQSVADARLRERPLAVYMIHLQGVSELGGILDFGIVDRMAATLLHRVAAFSAGNQLGYAGRMAESVVMVVAERFAGREALRDLGHGLLELLSEFVAVGNATFTVVPNAGIALLGDDGSDARHLLESARSAMWEARRSGPRSLRFYSGDLPVRSLVRLDIEQELRDAIAHDRLALRYAGRHRLDSGERVAVHAYLRWPHPARGEVAAAEFLPIAESTGLAVSLSRWALARFVGDIPELQSSSSQPLQFSFSPLKAHLTAGTLRSDLETLLAGAAVAPRDFELRISERVLAGVADPGASLQPLVELGVTVAIDEFGRGFTSLPRLARLPIRALQLDRRLALSAAADPVARRAVRAALAVAQALGLMPMSAGIDDEAQRHLFKSLGCVQGLGDAFGAVALSGTQVDSPRRRKTR